jgi:hypothetical protein
MKRKPIAPVLTMPPLRHSIPDQPFDIERSEVVRWLVHQPEVLQWLFNTMRTRGWIVYDRATGAWRGRDRRWSQTHDQSSAEGRQRTPRAIVARVVERAGPPQPIEAEGVADARLFRGRSGRE